MTRHAVKTLPERCSFFGMSHLATGGWRSTDVQISIAKGKRNLKLQVEWPGRMTRFLAGLLGLACLSSLTGCKQCDLVEAELRYRNRQVRQLQQMVHQKDAEIQFLQAMAGDGGAGCASATGGETPENVYHREAMSRVSLGMSTGPRDIDRDGTQDAIQFMIVCHDYDDDAFKCPGSAQIELHRKQESGALVPVANWQVDSDKLRETWKTSLLGSGYQVIVSTPVLEEGQNWRAVVAFETLDGRVFRDERDFSLRRRRATPKFSDPQPLPKFSEPMMPLEDETAIPAEPDAAPTLRLPETPSIGSRSWTDHALALTSHEQKIAEPMVRFARPVALDND